MDQDSGWEYDFWEVLSKPRAAASSAPGFGGRTRIDGDGLGSNSTAAHFGNLAGIIRAPRSCERGRIDHALFLVADCDSGELVYPAHGHRRPVRRPHRRPREGMRLQLDMSDRRDPRARRAALEAGILRAMARYGMFVGDTGGSPWDLEFESGSTYTSFGCEDPIVTSPAKRLGIVRRRRDGRYHFDVAKDIDWQSRLRVVDPCVTERTC